MENKLAKYYIDLPNGSIMKMLIEGNLKPGTFIAWDGRFLALKLLEENFQDNFLLYKPPTYVSAANPSGKFNVLQRKDNDLQFVDQRLRSMKSLGYFKEEVKKEEKPK